MTWLDWLLDTRPFPRRWDCCAPGADAWADIGWPFLVGELLIFAAYIAVPGLLVSAVKRRHRERGDVPASALRLLLLGAAFVLSCGIGHLLDALTFWWPAYRLLGLWHWVTAIVSLAAVAVMPSALRQLVALPSGTDLVEAQEEAEEERKRAVVAMNLANLELTNARMEKLREPLSDAASREQMQDRLEALRRDRMELLECERESHAKNHRTRERVRLLEKIIDRLGIALIWKDSEGKILYMNERTKDLSPLPEPTVEAIEGSDSLETWDLEDAAKYLEDDQRIIASGVSETYPETVNTAHGLRLLVTVACPVPDEDAILKACTDVTDIWRDVAALAEGSGL